MNNKRTPCPHPRLCGVAYHISDKSRSRCKHLGSKSPISLPNGMFSYHSRINHLDGAEPELNSIESAPALLPLTPQNDGSRQPGESWSMFAECVPSYRDLGKRLDMDSYFRWKVNEDETGLQLCAYRDFDWDAENPSYLPVYLEPEGDQQIVTKTEQVRVVIEDFKGRLLNRVTVDLDNVPDSHKPYYLWFLAGSALRQELEDRNLFARILESTDKD